MSNSSSSQTESQKNTFKKQSVVAARNTYKKLLLEFQNENSTLKTLIQNGVALSQMQTEFLKLYKNIVVDDNHVNMNIRAILEGNRVHFDTAAAKAIEYCTNPYEHMQDEKRLHRIQGSARATMAALDKTPEEINDAASQNHYLKNVYAKSRSKTRTVYQEMDYLFGVGQDFIFKDIYPKKALTETMSEEDSKKAKKEKKKLETTRLIKLLCIPEEHRIARWRYMLARADEKYDICLTDNRTNDEDNHYKLELFSRLYAQLSLHPRGADNECMPITHELRHNPAIHSLHTTALANMFFKEVEKEISKKPPETKDNLMSALHNIRKQIMMTALVHDLGESFGELSTVSKQSKMTTQTERDTFEEARAIAEKKVFLAQLDHVDAKINGALNLDKDHRNRIKHELKTAYELAEAKETFLGRFFKILERMQSQQDYLRFSGIKGASTLRNAGAPNKKFTLKYIPELLYGVKEYTLPINVNNTLRAFIQKEPANGRDAKTLKDMQTVFGMLCDAVEKEYNGPEHYIKTDKDTDIYPGLNRRLAEAIGQDPVDFIKKTRALVRSK